MGERLKFISDSPGEENSSALVNWREWVSVILERAWIGIAVAAAVFLFVWYNTLRETPYYRSTATLMVNTQTPQIFNFQDMMSLNTRSVEFFNTHIKALHSRPMVAGAIEEAGLSNHPAFTPGVSPGPDQVEAALRFIRIVPVERTRMLDVVVEHPDPEVAAKLANGLARAYIRIDLDSRMSTSMQAVDWLRDKAEEHRERLEAGLVKLQEYRRETQSVSLEEDQDIVVAKLKSLNSALTAAQTERIQRQTRWAAVETQLEAGIPPTEIVSVLEEARVIEAQRAWLQHRASVQQLRQRFRPEHPDFLSAMEAKQTARTEFEEAAQRAADRLRNQYELAATEEQNIRVALQEQEQEAFELDRKLVEYNEMRRNVRAEEEIYEAIITRMQEASLAGSIPTEIIQLVEEARPARGPFRPNRPRAMVRGASMGGVLGLLAIFGLHAIDHRIRHTEEVERKLGVQALGTLPLISAKQFSDRGLAAHLDDRSEAAEAFRLLRANLLLDGSNESIKSIMLTSAHPGEGKSLVASNLAISCAHDNRKILLVGADLRRPALHKMFDSDSTAGLSEVLEGKIEWRDAIIVETLPGLDVLLAGKPPPRPAELLGAGRWRKFLNEFEENYDLVVIDAPPVLGVSDTVVLLTQADAILYVLRSGVTHVTSARHALSRIDSSGAPCAGAVLNGVNTASMANYYYYRQYGYGRYGYRYGGKSSGDSEHARLA